MENKKLLEEYKRELDECRNELSEFNLKKKALEEIPIIQSYIQLAEKSYNLFEKYTELNTKYVELYQAECSHPLWYFLGDDTDSHEQRQLWVCSCVRCGVKKTGHSRDFEDKLIIESGNMGFGERCLTSYDEVREEYFRLESSQTDEEEIVLIMKKKYNNQK